MTCFSLEPHREFLIEVLQDDRVYSVAGLRQLALSSNFSGDLEQLTQALIWNYRIHYFLEEVDGFEFIKGKRYSAWTGSRWKRLLSHPENVGEQPSRDLCNIPA